MLYLGHTLLIANPTARSGKAEKIALTAHKKLIERVAQGQDFDPSLVLTRERGDGETIAATQGAEFDTIIVIGGDGIVHEVINGIMRIGREQRPRLGVISCGNGDDFARSLNLSRDPLHTLDQLLQGNVLSIDIGKVNDHYFAETLSFGFDAAIALQTTELRQKTKRTGTILYLQCALDQLRHNMILRKVQISLDNKPAFTKEVYMIAVQNGQHYGGGFQITPHASLTDGLFDICYATGPYLKPVAAYIFMQAKKGNHLGMKGIYTTQARTITLDFNDPIACQIDGEPLYALHYEAEVIPSAIEVIIPAEGAFEHVHKTGNANQAHQSTELALQPKEDA